MSRANLKEGRISQKLRTRNAIMEAAAKLISAGRTFTLEEVAATAEVSRATAYRYFPNPDALLLETQLHLLVRTPDELFPSDEGEPAERARRVLDHLQDMTRDNEPAFRQFMRGTMDQWLASGGKPVAPLRGARRLALLRKALEPANQQMDAKSHDRLVKALAMVVSMETYFAGRDICQLPPERISETMSWVVEVLVRASLDGG